MRSKFCFLLAGGCAILLALSIPAFSLPSRRGLDADQRAANTRGALNKKNVQRAPAQSPPAPVPAARPPVQEPSFM
jgi:hypothetical protein